MSGAPGGDPWPPQRPTGQDGTYLQEQHTPTQMTSQPTASLVQGHPQSSSQEQQRLYAYQPGQQRPAGSAPHGTTTRPVPGHVQAGYVQQQVAGATGARAAPVPRQGSGLMPGQPVQQQMGRPVQGMGPPGQTARPVQQQTPRPQFRLPKSRGQRHMLYAGRALPAAYLRAYRRDVGYVIKQDDEDPAILHVARPGLMPPPPTALLLCNCIMTIGVSNRRVERAALSRVKVDPKFSSRIEPYTPYLITPPRSYRLDSDRSSTASTSEATPAPSGPGKAQTPSTPSTPSTLGALGVCAVSADSYLSAADTPRSLPSLIAFRPFDGSKGHEGGARSAVRGESDVEMTAAGASGVQAPKRAFQWLGKSRGAARKAPRPSGRALVVEWEKREG
jgi:hypothetical protein